MPGISISRTFNTTHFENVQPNLNDLPKKLDFTNITLEAPPEIRVYSTQTLLRGTAITQGQEQLVLTSELEPEYISSSPYTAVFCITYQVNGEDFVLEHSLEGITPPPQGDDLIFPVDAIDGLRDIIATADSVKINGYLASSYPEPEKMTVIPFAFG